MFVSTKITWLLDQRNARVAVSLAVYCRNNRRHLSLRSPVTTATVDSLFRWIRSFQRHCSMMNTCGMTHVVEEDFKLCGSGLGTAGTWRKVWFRKSICLSLTWGKLSGPWLTESQIFGPGPGLVLDRKVFP